MKQWQDPTMEVVASLSEAELTGPGGGGDKFGKEGS